MEQNNEKKSFDLRGESKELAIKIIRLYQYLTEKASKKEYNLSKQLLIAGTRVGDYVRQKVSSMLIMWLIVLTTGSSFCSKVDTSANKI